MISKKTKILFSALSILFVVHGIEEYLTGFYNIDWTFKWAFWFIDGMTVSQASFLVFQIFFWLILLTINIFLFFPKSKFPLYFFTLVAIFELHHMIEAVITWSYYPGLFTSFLFPLAGYFLYKNLKK